MKNFALTSKGALLVFVALAAVFLMHLVPAGISTAASVLSAMPAPATNVPDPQQYPLLDKVADKVIQKYQNSTCEQLWQEKAEGKSKPKSEEEQRVITFLKSDAQMRTVFINKIAGPIANKMFECGMIP